MTSLEDTEGLVIDFTLTDIVRKQAVYNVLQSEQLILATHIGDKLNINWQGSPADSLQLVLAIIQIAKRDFGAIWLDELTKKLSLMA